MPQNSGLPAALLESSRNEGSVLGPHSSRAASLKKKNSKRDPNLENVPHMSKYPECLHIVCVAEPKQRAIEAVHCPNLEVHGYNDKYGYKSPKIGYDSSYLTYNPTYNYLEAQGT